MKDSDSSKRSSKKTNGRTGSKNSSPQLQAKSNGKTRSSPEKKNTKATTKSVMGATNSTNTVNNASKSSESLIDKNASTKSASSSPSKTKTSPRRAGKNSAELRPRRRASQTYFFKYQLARNPLKAEEEDLKMALLASLEQCGSSTGPTDEDSQESQVSVELTKKSKKCKQSLLKPAVNQIGKRPVGRPPKKPANHVVAAASNGLDKAGNKTLKSAHKKQVESQTSAESQKWTTASNNTAHKRRNSTESSSSSITADAKEEARRKKREYDRQRRRSRIITNNLKSTIKSHDDKDNITSSRDKVKASLSNCNDLKSVQNKIKKAKKLLQDKETNKGGNAMIGKFKALRKFPSKSNSPISRAANRRGASLLSSPINRSRTEKSGSKSKTRPATDLYLNSNSSTQNSTNSTSKNQYLMSYLPYTTWEKKDPPDEDYLNRYKPETEDFLTFICFRKTAPNYQPKAISLISANSQDDTNSCTNSNPFPMHTNNNNYADDNNSNSTVIAINNNSVSCNDRNNSDKLIAETKLQCNSASIKASNLNSSPVILTNHHNDHLISVNRRPTRQSPRLANSNKKISENDSSSHNIGTAPATAYENSITYEEDMKRASIALEDMAQEINSSDDIHNEIAQNTPDSVSRTSSPFKHNKHLVKGLMTREFAGAFADEDTIFESISNHKL